MSDWTRETLEPSVTVAEHRVLIALRQATADGWPASVREVGALAGLASSATAHHHLISLERQGLAHRHPRLERGGWLPMVAP